MVINYLLDKPDAMDTIQGIAEWWILKEQVKLTIKKVNNAIDYLLEKEYLKTVDYDGQDTYFQLNKSKIKEIEKTFIFYRESSTL